MDTHVRRLGVLSMVYGAAGALFSIILLISFESFSAMYHSSNSTLAAAALSVTVIAHLVLAAPLIVLGYYLLRFQEWARSVSIVVFALNMLNLPFGTVLGIYGLWVLFQPETEPLFLDPHFRKLAQSHGKAQPPPAKAVPTKAGLGSEPRS